MSRPEPRFLHGHAADLGAAYPVALPAFQGPLDLLLHLIERQELDINEISLVAVTDAYLRTLAALEELEPGALADFLVVASRLLYIKSRTLLPRLPATGEDDEEEDTGDALVRQLLEYRQFKEIAQTLRKREEAGLRVYVRMAPRPELQRQLDLGTVDLAGLHRALRRALARIPSDPPLPRVHTYTVTVAEQVAYVRECLWHHLQESSQQADRANPVQVGFTELLSRNASRMEVIVTFLAVLELIKQRELRAEQADAFAEIMLIPTPSSGLSSAPPHPPERPAKDASSAETDQADQQ